MKKKLVTATKGTQAFEGQTDELMRQFLDLVRENMALRQKVEAGILSANKNFVIAKGGNVGADPEYGSYVSKAGGVSGSRKEECDERGHPGV